MPTHPASAAQVLDLLVDLETTHIIGIPDNGSAALLDLIETDDRIESLTVTREGEAFAIASGLWMGGKSPVVVIQNTGLLESGDALRGTAMRMGIPIGRSDREETRYPKVSLKEWAEGPNRRRRLQR